MFLRMLRRDLKRKKTMNTILFIFIIIASMFMASGMNNVIAVTNGLSDYLVEAGVGDYNILTMGDHAVGALDDFLKNTKEIKDYRIEETIYASQKHFKNADGTDIDYSSTSGANLIMSGAHTALKFYDGNNDLITDPKEGEVYVSHGFLDETDKKIGDTIHVNHNGVEFDLKIVDICKDGFLGGAIVGNRRFIISDKDYNKLKEKQVIRDSYMGQCCYIDTDDTKAIKSALTNTSNVAFDGDKNLIKTSYLMDMILAVVMLIMSAVLIIVSLVILRFSIRFSIEEEFREIGVMKAIGIKNIKIRSLYIVKYLAMALIGSAVGFGISIPFGNFLLRESAKAIMLKNNDDVTWNIIGAVCIVIICILFGFMFTRRVKKFTPLDAIRSGQSGERYKKKNKYHLRKTHLKPGGYLALNDVISAPKRFFTIVLTFLLCTVLVLMMVNISSTMRSDAFADSFGKVSDLYIMDVDKTMKMVSAGSIDGVQDMLDDYEKKLSDAGIPGKLCVELQYKYPITVNGKDYSYTFQCGLGTKMEDYAYTEGTAPSAPDEIAITPSVSKFLGIGIGDKITVHFTEKDMDCIVTQIYETMNNMGELIRFHTDAPVDIMHFSSAMGIQIDFDDNPDKETISSRMAKVEDLFDTDEVMNAEDYCVDCMKVAPTMEALVYLLLAITMVVILLVTILTERTLIAGEVTQIATLKAIGFSNGAIVRWHTWRFVIVGAVVALLSAALSIPVTKLFGDPIYSLVGKSDVEYKIDVAKTFFFYPGIVLVVTVLVAMITALFTRKITARDTANIE